MATLSSRKKAIKYRLTTKVQGPSKAHESDAGWDLRVSEKVLLAPGERYTFETGLYLEIPDGYEVEIRPRSGIATKHGIIFGAQVVDYTYKGEIHISVINTSTKAIRLQNISDRHNGIRTSLY